MAININNNYINSANNGSASVSSVATSGQVSQNHSVDVSNLKSGQTLSGEIVSRDGNTVTLKLNDGQLLNARLNGNVDLSLGRLLSFEVNTNSSENSISLRPLYSNLSNQSTINAALKAAGLALTNTNISMTRSMMEEGMSIDRNSLLNMAKDVNAFQNASPSSIVQMTKLGMAVDELNVTQYENYRNFEHQIINDVNDLSESLTGLLSDNSGNDSVNIPLAHDIFSLIDSSLLEEAADADLEDEAGLTLKEAIENGDEIGLAADAEIADDVGAKGLSALKDVFLKTISDITGKNQENSTVTEEINRENVNAASSSDSLAALKELALITGTEIPDKQDLKGTIDFLKNALNSIENNELPDKDYALSSLSRLLNSSDIKTAISDALKSQLTIAPDKITKEGAIDELYGRILKFTQKAMEIGQNAGNATEMIQNSAQNLQDNVNFMNQLNQFVNYVQLPLKMYQENAHGELYVYSNKKNIAENEGNLTALLHLDMEHLGPMDVYVSMKNYTNVSTNFRLANEEILDFIEANIHILNERLEAKGYSMTTNVTTGGSITGEDTPITEEFLKESPEDLKVRAISNLQFDVRA